MARDSTSGTVLTRAAIRNYLFLWNIFCLRQDLILCTLIFHNLGIAMTNTIPDLGYAPVADIFKLPPGVNFGPCSGIAITARNHILVFNRSENALMEFTQQGDWVRTMGRGIFNLPHGLRIDREGNIWCTDTGAHIVVKMNADGRILMVLGVAGRAGEWHHADRLPAADVAPGHLRSQARYAPPVFGRNARSSYTRTYPRLATAAATGWILGVNSAV